MKQPNKKGTGVYLRLALQCELGIWSQEQKVNHYLQKVGDTENVHYYKDNGYSGLTVDRPALQALMHQVSEGKIGKVVVDSASRLARGYLLMVELLQFFDTHDVQVVMLDSPTTGTSLLEVMGAQA